MSTPEKNLCKLTFEDYDVSPYVIEAIKPVKKFLDIDAELNRILSRRKGPKITVKYYKEIDTDIDICRSILTSLGKKGHTEQLVYNQMEKYDSTGQGVIPLDKFYLVFDQLNSEISGLEVQELVKRWYPDSLISGNVNYGGFLSRLY